MATSSRRRCLNESNVFCCICGEYTLHHNKKTISGFLKRAYLAYFKVMLGDQDKPWAPHIVCKPCVEHLWQWTNKSRKSLRFAIPIVWREPKDHCNDCYFCAVKTKDINRKNRNSLTYPDLDSAIRPIPHSEELPVPVFEGLRQLEFSLSSEEEDVSIDSDNTLANNDFPPSLLSPQLFSQGELNDLERDLNLSEESSELLASRLKEKNLLKPDTLITFYRKCHEEFLPYFTQDNEIVYRNNAEGLLKKLGVFEYDPNDWRLFIDSCKRSLKCVLLHDGNAFGSNPLGHSTTPKEKYSEINFVLVKISYYERNWIICVDLKMIGFLLGLQCGYTKFPCFLCLWNSRDRAQHWMKQDWPVRELVALVERCKFILPPLHITLGIMKQFVKALNKDGDCFKCTCTKFPGSTIEKLIDGTFDGPQMRTLINDRDFPNSMS